MLWRERGYEEDEKKENTRKRRKLERENRKEKLEIQRIFLKIYKKEDTTLFPLLAVVQLMKYNGRFVISTVRDDSGKSTSDKSSMIYVLCCTMGYPMTKAIYVNQNKKIYMYKTEAHFL